MSQQCYLGIDLGAESGRVIAGLFDGNQIRIEELHRFSNGPVYLAETMRWNVLGLWSEIEKGLMKAQDRYGDSIISMGVDTWGVDYVLLDRNDELLGQPWHYRDSKNQGIMQWAFKQVSQEEIFRNSGLQFMEINSLYQLLATQQQHPDLLSQAKRFLMMPDFFHWCLCGSRVVEFTNATTSQCYHPTEQNWAIDMLKQFHLPTEIFPDVVPPGTKLGTLRESVAQRVGMKRVNVVTPATHDTGSAVAAIPTDRTGSANWAYISSGTWSLMGVEIQNAILTPDALRLNVTNEGGIDGTYRLLKNIMGLWLVQQIRVALERQGQDYDYAQLAQEASSAEPFRSLIPPNDNRFLNPKDMISAMQNWCRDHDEPIPETPGQLVRCAIESLALKYREVLQKLVELTGTPVEVVHIVGGGTKNRLLNQFTANACGCPVITGPVEATVLGNLLVQARTAGELSSLAEIRDVVRRSSEVEEYKPTDISLWSEAAERFAKLREA